MTVHHKHHHKRRHPHRHAKRKSHPTRSVNPRYQISTIEETYDDQSTFLTNVSVKTNFSLYIFQRAYYLSQMFEQFRIEEVKFTYTPLFNTFQESATTASVPYIYFLKDRLNSLNPTTVTLQDLVKAGAQRHRFDKPLTYTYKPNTLAMANALQPAGVSTEILQVNTVEYDKWFPCVTQNVGIPNGLSSNTIAAASNRYYGHFVYVEQMSVTPTLPMYNVTISARISFKNALLNKNVIPTPNEDLASTIWTVGYSQSPPGRVFGLPPTS